MKGDKIYTHIIPNMPRGIHEFVAPCFSGYNVYISDSLDEPSRKAAFEHAVMHIAHGDFDSENDIQSIEWDTHFMT